MKRDWNYWTDAQWLIYFKKTSDKVKNRLTTTVCFFPGISGCFRVLLTTIIVTYCGVVWVLLSMFSIVWMTSFGDSPTTPAWPLLYRLFQTKAGRVASMRGYWRRVRCASRERWEGSQMAGGEMIWHYGNRILPSNFCFTLPHGHSTADFLETNPFTSVLQTWMVPT